MRGCYLVRLLYFIFTISGAAGLIYEAIWPRYIKLFVGHSAYAQVVVLATFLGGMSLGALMVGRRAEGMANPLRLYALIELTVGIIGLVFHPIYLYLTDLAYSSLFPFTAGTIWLGLVKWGLAVLLILPQSVLLGTTFPLMSAAIIRRVGLDRSGRTLSMLYFCNSFGAAIGVLIAGFWMVGRFGLPGTGATAGFVNILVAAIVLSADRFLPKEVQVPDSDKGVSEVKGQSNRLLTWALLGLAFMTAVASFIYEISWIRMFSLILGSSTHVFELMLSAFIMGIALGGLFIRRWIDRLESPLLTLSLVQWLMGLAAVFAVPMYRASFSWTASLMSSFNANEAGYVGFNLSRYLMCFLLMLPATFCAGMTLPLITRILFRETGGERSIGYVYGINTLGSIFGVLLASLLLMPALGLKGLLVFGGGLDMILGVVLVLILARGSERFLKRGLLLGSGTVAALLIVCLNFPFDSILMASGVFRTGQLKDPRTWTSYSHRDGRTCTVSVFSIVPEILTLSVNGKPDASIGVDWKNEMLGQGGGPKRPLAFDESTMILTGLLPLVYAPEAKRAAIIGQGSGLTSHFLLASEKLERLDTIEIEVEVISGSRYFYPTNSRVFDDDRSHIVINDAKAYFATQNQTYDIIISEPSNPWVSGVASLFTQEFYQRVRQYLSEDGVFGQWIQVYEINDELVITVLRTLHEVFPYYEIYQSNGHDLMILAGNRKSLVPDWSVFELGALRKDFNRFLPIQAEAVRQLRWLTRDDLAPMMAGFQQMNSDYAPILEMGAEKVRYLKEKALGLADYWDDPGFNLHATLGGQRLPFGSSLMPSGVPVVGQFGVSERAIALRSAYVGSPLTKLAKDYFGEDLYRLNRFRKSLLDDRVPESWKLWVEDCYDVYSKLHGASSGQVFQPFFDDIYAYMARFSTPTHVLASFQFLEGLSSWNFEQAATAATTLLKSRDRPWLKPRLLRNGAVVANLKLGRFQEAARFLKPTRQRQNLADMLLRAHVEAGLAKTKMP